MEYFNLKYRNTKSNRNGEHVTRRISERHLATPPCSLSEIKVNSLFCPGGREEVILRDICHVRSSPSRTLSTPPRSSSFSTTWKVCNYFERGQKLNLNLVFTSALRMWFMCWNNFSLQEHLFLVNTVNPIWRLGSLDLKRGSRKCHIWTVLWACLNNQYG